jgi:hypothetical protein
MRPAAWQAPGCLGDEARHDPAILTGPDAVTQHLYVRGPISRSDDAATNAT